MAAERATARACYALLLGSYLVLPPVSMLQFQGLSCDTLEHNGARFLRADSCKLDKSEARLRKEAETGWYKGEDKRPASRARTARPPPGAGEGAAGLASSAPPPEAGGASRRHLQEAPGEAHEAPGRPRTPQEAPGSPQGVLRDHTDPYGSIRIHKNPYGPLPHQFQKNIWAFFDKFWKSLSTKWSSANLAI